MNLKRGKSLKAAETDITPPLGYQDWRGICSSHVSFMILCIESPLS